MKKAQLKTGVLNECTGGVLFISEHGLESIGYGREFNDGTWDFRYDFDAFGLYCIHSNSLQSLSKTSQATGHVQTSLVSFGEEACCGAHHVHLIGSHPGLPYCSL